MKNNLLKVLFLSLLLLSSGLSRLSAHTTSIYARESVLSSGHWVKVNTDTTGIYQISYDQLRAWGFADPAKVSMYGYGAVIAADQTFPTTFPDDLPATPLIHTADDRILFFAEGDVRCTINRNNPGAIDYERNHYDTKGTYFLTDSREPAKIISQSYNSSGLTFFPLLDWHYAISLIEREVQNPGNGGAFFHGQQLQAGQSEDFPFRITNYHRGSATGYFHYDAAVKSGLTTKISIAASGNIHLLTNSPKNSTTSNSNVRLYCSANGEATFSATDKMPLQDENVNFKLTIPSTFQGNYAAIDKAYIIYPQTITLEDRPELIINLRGAVTGQNFAVRAGSSDMEVWNVTHPEAIYRYELSYDQDSQTAYGSLQPDASYGSSRLVAFSTAAPHREVSYAGQIEPQNIHAAPVPEMLIVTNATCRQAAMELAELHRSIQNMDVLVVTQEEVFNEFSSGVRHPGAIRRMAKMFYDRDPLRFKNLLLYGTATWDNRALVLDPADHLISYQVEIVEQARETTTNYCADQYFGMLSDVFTLESMAQQGRMHINVGRIPAQNISMARIANEKIRRRLTALPSPRDYLRTVFLSDRGDSNAHFIQSCEAADTIQWFSPAFTTTRADIELYPANGNPNRESEPGLLLKKAFSAGAGYFTYSGHGDGFALTGDNIYTRSVASSLTYPHWPIAMLSTCAVLPIDRKSNSLGEKMFFNPEGGMIGIIASCRAVYLEHNKSLNNAVATTYATAPPGTTAGDLIRIARNLLINNGSDGVMASNLGHNTLAYNLCGDPATPIDVPDYTMAIDIPAEIDALIYNNVEATVTGPDGSKIDSFNGMAVIDVYDTPIIRTNVLNKNLAVNTDETILATFTAPVIDGTMHARVVLPSPTDGSGQHRIVVTAVDTLARKGAAGVATGICINSADAYDPQIDTSAPVIEEMYIDTPAFADGDAVGSQFTLTAIIDPSATGLRFGDANLASTTALHLDHGSAISDATNAIRPTADGKMRLDYIFSDMADGSHTLTLKVLNNAGESSSAKLDFCVASLVKGSLSIDTEATVRNQVTFTFNPEGHEISSGRLVVLDSAGNTVITRRGILNPYTWNLVGDDNSPVPDGLYKAYVQFSTPHAYGSTEPIEFVVVK